MKPDALISLLRRNARASNFDLAGELNTSEEVVAEEIARLEQEGVILGYQAIVDPQKVNSGNGDGGDRGEDHAGARRRL